MLHAKVREFGVDRIQRHIFLCADQTEPKCCAKDASLESWSFLKRRLSELGLKDFAQPHKITCEDHEGSGPVIIQQWDGKNWKMVSEWIPPMRDVIRPMIEKAAANYAKENNITPRSCK